MPLRMTLSIPLDGNASSTLLRTRRNFNVWLTKLVSVITVVEVLLPCTVLVLRFREMSSKLLSMTKKTVTPNGKTLWRSKLIMFKPTLPSKIWVKSTSFPVTRKSFDKYSGSTFLIAYAPTQYVPYHMRTEFLTRAKFSVCAKHSARAQVFMSSITPTCQATLYQPSTQCATYEL